MSKLQPLQVRYQLANTLNEYKEHLDAALVEADKQVAWHQDWINNTQSQIDYWNRAKTRARATANRNYQLEAKAIVSLRRENETLEQALESAKNYQNSEPPRIVMARKKLKLVIALQEALPSIDQVTEAGRSPEKIQACFQKFTESLDTSYQILSEVRRDGTTTDSDNMVLFLKTLAVILSGIIPGLIVGAALTYFGFFNPTGANAVNTMEKALKDLPEVAKPSSP